MVKVAKGNEELRGMSIQDLQTKISHVRRELVSMRLNMVAGHLKDVTQCRKSRKNLARMLTHLRQKELEQKQ